MARDCSDRAFRMRSGGVVVTEVLEHEGGGVDGGQGVGDPLAGDVVGRPVHRLEQRRSGPVRVQVGRGGEPDAPADGTGQVGQDVAEEVVGDDDVVAPGLLHQVDAGGIDVVVVPGDVGEFGGHLGDGAVPQIAGEGEDVGLVHQGQVVVGPAVRQLEGEPHTALDAHAGVDRPLGGHLGRRPLAQEPALAGVGPLGVLPDDDEVGPFGDRSRDAGEGTEVHVQVEREAQAEQEATLESARRHRRVPHRRPDGAEENGVVAPQLFEHLVGQDRPVPQVAGGPQVEVGGLELDTGRRHHLERLGADLGPDAVAADDRHPPVLRACAH